MNMNRRQFFKVCSAGLGGSSIALMGFSPTAALAEVRTFKLARATETRNICPYCSVSCGVLIYSTGDKSKNSQSEIIHIEGDPDNPVNRGTLCPKGAGLRDMIQSENRLKWPEVREAGRQRFNLGHTVIGHVKHSYRNGSTILCKNASHANLATNKA